MSEPAHNRATPTSANVDATRWPHVANAANRATDRTTNESRDTGDPGRRRGQLPLVSWLKPRCPNCGSANLRRYRSIADQGDGSSLSWVRCQNPACELRFRLVME